MEKNKTMDQIAKLKLIARIKTIEQSSSRQQNEILISLDDYFNGNDETCCIILCNSVGISAKELDVFLRKLKKQTNVFDILIRFNDYEDALDDDSAWINSDTIYVITSASIEEVNSWFEKLQPSRIEKFTNFNDFANLPRISDGLELFSVWWD